MKSQGFDLEQSQIETPQVMAKLILAVLIAALRTMQLVYARSGTTGQKLSDAMDETAEPLVEALTAKLEGKTAKLKNPHARGTLARLSWVVGRLGGWDGYDGHGYKPAGPITMARGLVRFDAIREGWEMLRELSFPRSATAPTASVGSCARQPRRPRVLGRSRPAQDVRRLSQRVGSGTASRCRNRRATRRRRIE